MATTTAGARGCCSRSRSWQVAVIFAALLGVGLSARLTPAQMSGWGWRVPLLIGCAILPLLFLIRRSLVESGEFAARVHRPPAAAIVRSTFVHWRIVLRGVLLVTMTTVSFYTITAYTPTFGRQVLRLGGAASLVVTLCVGLSNLFWLPVMGALSDRIGRKPLLVACAALALVTIYPAMR